MGSTGSATACWSLALVTGLLLGACSGTPRDPPRLRPAEVPPLPLTTKVVSRVPVPPRFVGVNLPNLHYIEDDWRFDSPSRYRLPTDFEIRDALSTVRQMGGTVTRIYALSVKKPQDPPQTLRHVKGPGVFDEPAFEALDRVVELAEQFGVRLIIPLVDNWSWWGGVAEYAAFRGRPREDFFTDPTVIGDFERTIEFLLERRNTRTGRLYREDPTILALEIGNELLAPWSYTEKIAQRIREHDSLHPIVDNYHSPRIRQEALESPLVDWLSTHHYTDGARAIADIRANLAQIGGKKPYYVGEFGFLDPSGTKGVLETVIDGGALGALLWSLRGHNRDGGFYWHGEREGYAAYHWPGFGEGTDRSERELLWNLREKAFEIRGQPAQALLVPDAPAFLPDSSPSAISFLGSAGASHYELSRARGAEGPWQILTGDLSDAELGYRPTFMDQSAPLDTPLFYRLRAKNAAGWSAPSAVLGPVIANTRRWVDEFSQPLANAEYEGAWEWVSDQPMAYNMDNSRAVTSSGTLFYRSPGRVQRLMVDLFALTDPWQVTILGAEGRGRFRALQPQVTNYSRRADQPPAVHPIRLLVTPAFPVDRLQIRVESPVEFARVEADYRP